MRRAALVLALALALLLPGTPTRAQTNTEAALVLRVLSYDRNLRQRSPGREVIVMAVHAAGNSRSERECGALVAAINQLGRSISVSGMRARAVTHAWSGADALKRAARAARATGIYLCPGFEPDVDVLAQATRDASLLSISPRESDVRGGLTVGIVRDGRRVRLVINVRAAQAEGARLDAALLRIATVVR